MFKTISAALIAVSLIAGPALAQTPVAGTTTTKVVKNHGKVAVVVKTKRHRHAVVSHRHRHVVVIKHKRLAKHHARHNASAYLRVN